MSRKQKRQNNQKAMLDVVITTGGRFDMLSKCLDVLYQEAEHSPISIYIVDNASPSEERIANEHLFVEREGSQVIDFRTKRLTQEVGFPASNNEGARMGQAPLIMFLNDDVEFKDGATIDKILRTMDDPSIGICGIKLCFPMNSTSPIRPAGKVQHVGMALNIRGEPVHPLVGWSFDHPKTNISRDVTCVTGACLTVRRSLWNKVGGFSLDYGRGTFEDVDLCFKIRQLGARVRVITEAWGYHYVGATAEKKKTSFPIRENLLLFQSKWQNSGWMMWGDWEFM